MQLWWALVFEFKDVRLSEKVDNCTTNTGGMLWIELPLTNEQMRV